jgi:prepilin-type N-terminal cleavage/methylation domain-containing protein
MLLFLAKNPFYYEYQTIGHQATVLTGFETRRFRSSIFRTMAACADRMNGPEDTGVAGRGTGRNDAGFSLIELMVVVSIVATLSMTAVLGLRVGTQGAPAVRIDDLARALRYLQAEALFTNRSFALSFAQTGWQVLVFAENERVWQVRPAKALHAAGEWGADNRVSLRIEGTEVLVRDEFPDAPAPDAFVLPSGETTSFQLTLVGADGQAAGCTMQTYGELECQRGG